MGDIISSIFDRYKKDKTKLLIPSPKPITINQPKSSLTNPTPPAIVNKPSSNQSSNKSKSGGGGRSSANVQPAQPTVVQTPSGGVSTAFPEKYEQPKVAPTDPTSNLILGGGTKIESPASFNPKGFLDTGGTKGVVEPITLPEINQPALSYENRGTLTDMKPVYNPEVRVLEAPTNKTGIDAWEQGLSRARSKNFAGQARGGNALWYNIKGFGIEAASIPVGTLAFGKGILTNPIGTLGGAGASVFNMAMHPLETGARAGNILLQEPGMATGFVVGTYLTGKATDLGLTKGFQYANLKMNPKAVGFENSGMKLVEGTTIPTSKSKLLSLEGTKVDTVHMTFSKGIDYGTELKPIETGATGWRKDIGQFNFYQSIPSEGKPVMYGGYVGIGEQGSSSITKLSLFKPNVKAFIFREQEITPTPGTVKGMSAKNIIDFQTKTPGTFIPGENIKGLSREGQVATSVGTLDSPIFKIEKNMEAPLYDRFTYYNQKKAAPDFIGNSPALKKGWDFFTSKNTKINFKEAKLTQIGEGTEPGYSKGPKSEDIFSSGKSVRYVSSGDIFSKGINYLPKFGSSGGFSSTTASKAFIPKFSSPASASKGTSKLSMDYSPSYVKSDFSYNNLLSYPKGSKSTGYSSNSFASKGASSAFSSPKGSWSSGLSSPNKSISIGSISSGFSGGYSSVRLMPSYNFSTMPIAAPLNLGFTEKPRPRAKPKRKYRRVSSLVSAELGIFSSKPISGEMSGIVSRPMLSRSKGKREKGVFSSGGFTEMFKQMKGGII